MITRSSTIAIILLSILFACPHSIGKSRSNRGSGIVYAKAGVVETAAYDGLIQTDGKLLAVGTFALDSPPFYAVRYNTNGTLDTSFNTTARLYAAIGGTDSAYVSLLFPDASMGVYGPAGGYAAIGVLRFDASGGIELNSTFSTSGKGIYAGTLQTNGHAVLVGDNTPEPFFTRLDASNVVDTSFNTEGSTTIVLGAGSSSLQAAAIQENGKILGFGASDALGLVIRLNSEGTLDTTFATTGIVTTADSENLRYEAAVIQTDGRLVAGGSIGFASEFGLVRYLSDGTLDTSFYTIGIARHAFTASDQIMSIALQSNGQVVAVGNSNSNNDAVIVRFRTDGSLDTSFATQGMLLLGMSGRSDHFEKVVIQTDGKFSALGRVVESKSLLSARFNSNGSLDTSFATQGFLSDSIVGDSSRLRQIILDSSGSIVAVGSVGTTYSPLSVVMRFTPRGTLDTTFNTTGQVISDLVATPGLYSVALQTDSKLIVGSHSAGDLLIMRYLSSGGLDTSFNTRGYATKDEGNAEVAYSTKMQTDGKILMVGESSSNYFAVFRYNSNGTLDTSFRTDGTFLRNLSAFFGFQSVALQTNGRILLGGGQLSSSYGLYALRLDAAGNLDTSFNTTGELSRTFVNSLAIIYTASLDANERFVFGGMWNNNLGDESAVLIRINTDGSLDTSFNTVGRAVLDWTIGTPDTVYAVGFTANEKIIAAGYANGQFAISRFLTNGTLDTTFGTEGYLLRSVGEAGGTAYSMGINSQGDILVGGSTQIGLYFNFALMKFAP